MADVRDQQIIDEADRQRRHELKMAEIDAKKHADTEHNTTLRRQSRHEMFAWVAGIGGAVAIILTIIISIASATSEDRDKEIKIREQQIRVAEQCISSDNIWVDGDCLIGQKNTQ
jgi:hypothetical protein